MKRRDFVRLIVGATASPLAARQSVSQSAPDTRAAVVIGVNKAGDLPVLRAAISGARDVAKWLQTEGFEVKLLIDDRGPVRARDVFLDVSEFVNRGTLDQLVIYFAGHGFLNPGRGEVWLLSDAPENAGEASQSVTHYCRLEII